MSTTTLEPKSAVADAQIVVDTTQCPKCGGFIEVKKDWDNGRNPGRYCNKEGCGWFSGLIDPLPVVRPLAEWLIPPTLVELLKKYPGNDTGRLLLASHTDLAVPPQLATWDDLAYWLERATTPFKVAPKQRHCSISVTVNASEKEIGRADWSAWYNATEDLDIDMRNLIDDLESLANDGGTLDNAVKELQLYIGDNWSPSYFSLELDDDTEEISNRECTDTVDLDVSLASRQQAKDTLRNYLEEHNPELLGQFLDNESEEP